MFSFTDNGRGGTERRRILPLADYLMPRCKQDGKY